MGGKGDKCNTFNHEEFKLKETLSVLTIPGVAPQPVSVIHPRDRVRRGPRWGPGGTVTWSGDSRLRERPHAPRSSL